MVGAYCPQYLGLSRRSQARPTPRIPRGAPAGGSSVLYTCDSLPTPARRRLGHHAETTIHFCGAKSHGRQVTVTRRPKLGSTDAWTPAAGFYRAAERAGVRAGASRSVGACRCPCRHPRRGDRSPDRMGGGSIWDTRWSASRPSYSFRSAVALAKRPPETWRTYGPLFNEHATAVITPELLAAIAQVESSGNPMARTYWRWRPTRSASSCTNLRRARSAGVRADATDTDFPGGEAVLHP